MRTATDAYAAQVARGAASKIEIVAWLGQTRIGPVDVVRNSWSVSDAEDQDVPGDLTFQVPNTPAWRPTGRMDHLAAIGHRFQVRAGVDHDGMTEWLNLGWFLAKRPTWNDDVLQVEGVGLLEIANRFKFPTPFSAAASTRANVLRKITPPVLPVQVNVADEAMPAWTCDQDRLAGMREICDAWPARLWVDDDGVMQVSAPWVGSDSVDVEWLDGPGGTLSSAVLSSETDAPTNWYVASNVPQGDAQAISAQWVMTQGPYSASGPYGASVGFSESAAAGTSLTKLKRIAEQLVLRGLRRADAYKVVAAPDARVQLGDVARVRDSRAGLDMVGRVTSITHTAIQLEATVAWMSGVRR